MSLSKESICPEMDFPCFDARNTANAAISLGSTNALIDSLAIAASLTSSID